MNTQSTVSTESILAKVFALFPALALLMTVKGGFVGMSWERPVKMRKEYATCRFSVFKRVSCVGRVGVNHENRAKVKEARESGALPEVNQGLPWGTWLLFPYFITHRGNVYVRLYPVEGSMPQTTYLQNGKVISKAEAQKLCLASEFSEVNQEVGCMTLNISNLRQVKYSETQVDVENVKAVLVSV